eukprot:TRINITY_DN5302_c0_g1_i4.p1 TRINITY_DN5302_c0_g1~~TRINITY_DN5302_c0_g1_i4.p1  ORF type:complete len:441 (+),score=140.45 TRINITY_DN5302_c0_g1_i4:32-1324(+)
MPPKKQKQQRLFAKANSFTYVLCHSSGDHATSNAAIEAQQRAEADARQKAHLAGESAAATAAPAIADGDGEEEGWVGDESDYYERSQFELGEYGFPDDGYDYSQHLRQIGVGGGMFVCPDGTVTTDIPPVPASEEQVLQAQEGAAQEGKKAKAKGKAKKAPLVLAEEAGAPAATAAVRPALNNAFVPDEHEEDPDFRNASVQKLDPEVEKFLNGDVANTDDYDEMPDDFVAQLMQGGEGEGEGEDEGGEGYEYGGEFGDEDEDEGDGDYLGEEREERERQRKLRPAVYRGAAHAENACSPVDLPRTQEQQLLDEQFDRVLEEYDSDEIGELDEDATRGTVSLEDGSIALREVLQSTSLAKPRRARTIQSARKAELNGPEREKMAAQVPYVVLVSSFVRASRGDDFVFSEHFLNSCREAPSASSPQTVLTR